MISIVVAIGNGRLHNRVLGKDNKLLWHIPEDLKRFKALTLGHPVIMGRKTFESVVHALGKPLPGRTNIVVTRQASTWDLRSPTWIGVVAAGSLEDAIVKARRAPGGEEIFIGGGGEIYRQALRLVDKLYLTLIEDDKEGDSYFPEYQKEFTKVTFDESHDYDGLKYRWVDLER